LPPRRSAPLALVATLGLCLGPAFAVAQEGGGAETARALGFEATPGAPVALVADQVLFDEAAGTVTARGGVEVFYGPRTLTAAEIVYDSRAGRIRATGPITLRGEEGTTVFADAADLDAELADGIVQGARAVMAGGGAQLAAVEGRRIGGRYNAVAKAVYSACTVCPDRPTPLWSIRARRAVHDEVERVVHYEDAVFEALGVPVAWLPFFSFPDPTVRRRSGFLPPTFQQSSTYGFAVKAPYFIVLDDSRDLTITPFPTTGDGPIVEGEYRQRFDAGGFDARGSFGALDMGEGEGREGRAHLFADGDFDAAGLGLGAGTRAGFDIALASDDGYLRRYDFTDQDRLENEIFVERYGLREFFDVSAYYVQSLRADEPDGEVPYALPRFELRRTVDDPLAGGEIGLGASGVQLMRDDGRDVGRVSFQADWERRETLDAGILLRAFALGRADVYRVRDDPAFDDETPTRLAPLAGAEARYPFVARMATGAHILEPVAQFVVAPQDVNPDEIPNEDSAIVEFDETNLFDPDRFPGFDRFESGARVNAGLRYAWITDAPLRVDVSAGRVFRLTEETAFSAGSGLDETRSDYVAAWTVAWEPLVAVTNRVRIDDALDVSRNELAARFGFGPARLEGAYVYYERDPVAGAFADRAEGTLGGALDVTRNWTVGGFARRDFEEGRYVDLAATLTYETECAALELFAGRDFTDSEDDPASTTVGLRVRLYGTADGRESRSAVCGLRPSP
jgi:LPS-assembly protein